MAGENLIKIHQALIFVSGYLEIRSTMGKVSNNNNSINNTGINDKSNDDNDKNNVD